MRKLLVDLEKGENRSVVSATVMGLMLQAQAVCSRATTTVAFHGNTLKMTPRMPETP